MTLKASGGRVRLTDRISIGVLTRVFPRDLVDEVIAETGRVEKRSRLLPARVVVYYVLALALFFGDAYGEVMRRLVWGLRFTRGWSDTWKVPTTSAISQARARLGETPLKELFHRAAVPIARKTDRSAWYEAWRVMAIDGVILDAPDTPDNNAVFAHSSGGKGASAFPCARVIAMAECGTHAIVSATIGTWTTNERTLVPALLPDIEPDMLVLADRGLYSYRLWHDILDRGADLLFRVPSNMVLPALETHPDGSYRSVLLDPLTQRRNRRRAQRRARPGDGPNGNLAELEADGTPCRVVEYHITHPDHPDNPSEPYRIITSITDPDEAPAHELAALYRERWEFELSLDEIEIHQIGGSRVLRSKTPEMIKQEIWGILLTHYAIRRLIYEAADTIDTDPDRISFLNSLRIIRRQVTSRADFPPS
jgi:hypothetical protein